MDGSWPRVTPKGCGSSPRDGDTVGRGDAPDSGLLVRQRQLLAGTRRLWGRNAKIFIITSLPLTPGQQ